MSEPAASGARRPAAAPGAAARGEPWPWRVASWVRRTAARERTTDTVWGLFDQGAALVASTLSFLLLGRTLGPSGYGAYVGLYALVGPFLALSRSGVQLAVLEHVTRAGEDPDEVTRSCLSITLANASLCVPLLTVVGLRWIEGLPALTAALLVATEFFLNGVVTTCAGMVQAGTGFAAAARLRIVAALARIALLTALAAAGALTLTTLAVGQVATLGAVMLLALAKVSRLLGAPARPGRIRRPHVRSALLYGIGIGASGAQADGDKFVLNAAHHQADAGRYAAAYRLMQLTLLPVGALVGATHLSFLDAAESGRAQLRRAIRLSSLTMVYAVPAVVLLIVAAPWVPRILTKDFAETAFILQMLAPVVILRGIASFPMNGLMGLGHNALRTKLLVGNAALSLALYAALIPTWSWRGALAATLATEVTLCASGWVALLWVVRARDAEPGDGASP